MAPTRDRVARPPLPSQLVGGWEVGLLVFMVAALPRRRLINPRFFGSTDALHRVLRDTARYGVMAVGMTFVIVNKDLDLSVGSTYGLIGVVFSIAVRADLSRPAASVPAVVALPGARARRSAWSTACWSPSCKVPAFIATLTMLFIGRGFVLGLTGGKTSPMPIKAQDYPLVLPARRDQRPRLQQPDPDLRCVVAVVGAVVLAKTRWGYETFATGGNEQAATYAGIPTRWVRIRAYLLSSLCATLAGLMTIAQDKGVTAAVRPGRRAHRHRRGDHRRRLDPRRPRPGARRLPRRDAGRADRQGAARGLCRSPASSRSTATRCRCKAMAQLPAGAVPAFLGLHPARRGADRALDHPRAGCSARLLGLAARQAAAAAARDRRHRHRGRCRPRAAMATDTALARTRLRQVPGAARRAGHHPGGRAVARRASISGPTSGGTCTTPSPSCSTSPSWRCSPIGLTYVIANGDIDLSVGAVLALAGADRGVPDEGAGLRPG